MGFMENKFLKLLFLITFFALARVSCWASAEPYIMSLISSNYIIYINKSDHKLSLVSYSDTLLVADIACGKVLGNKRKKGDCRTPEGIFVVEEILCSADWAHDFHDGRGTIKGAYGPYFVRLTTPWRGIGIHGTHDESSIGTDATEGCIRLKNEVLQEFVRMIHIGDSVIIFP